MDAQNAADKDEAKPSAASPHRRRASHVDVKPAASTSPSKDDKSKPSAAARADDANDDRDSDAETIVLPGKDGHSPSKARKVRQEDKGESDGDASKEKGKPSSSKSKPDEDVDAEGEDAADADADADDGLEVAKTVRPKRLSSTGSRPSNKDAQSRSKDGASSGLSSAPNSPTQNKRRLQRRRSDAAPASPSDSEGSNANKSTSKSRDKQRLASQKRKAPKVESDDEADGRKARRQRTTSAGVDNPRSTRDGRVSSRSQREARTQSTSPPPPRQHRRSVSTQLPSSSNGQQQKKKRLPPPLQATDYQSDDSSASGSPHPRSTKLRSLVTPSHSDAHVSPAKIQPHKKHLDAHGQTLLARACARGEYDGVKQRLMERPEDLNVADYAGNTPLQIAAINGAEDIVKLLLEAGCNVDCVNYDKDTPLLDAVDNGHLEVVRLLLDAGVNPRKANVNGEEPIDRVTDEMDNGEEIRAALIAARKRLGGRRRTSEDRHSHNDPDGRDSNAPDSPRRSPATLPSGRRGGTVRSTKTRNDLLYMPLDDKTLRQAAGRGDEETVARVLQVKEGFDDPESMVAAARGGHDLVIQLLLGLGGANADPAPVPSLQAEFATPILAAIGQENIKVVELLLEQQGFDPTRRFKGETYYEIARRRQGTNWKEEEDLLRNAYDEHKRSHKDGAPTKSPGRREREREEKRSRREEARAEAKRERRSAASPTREERTKAASAKLNSPGSKRRSASFSNNGDGETQRRGPGRPRKASINASDREPSPTVSGKPAKTKRAESDAAAGSSDGESTKPRRKLISKGELRGERDKQKRPGAKEPTSPRASRSEESSEKPKVSEKYHDRAKALKRDETREGDGPSKRHRTSLTPDRPSDADKDDAEAPVKRRRLDSDAQEKKGKRSSGEEKTSKANSKDGAGKGGDDEPRGKSSTDRRGSSKSESSEKQVQIKSEDVDVAMSDAPTKETAAQQKEAAEAVKKKEDEEAAAKEEEERKRLAEEEKKREEEAARKREEEEKAKKLQEEERRRREAEEAARREEEERKKKEEEERKQREEEERQRREQLEREAAEEERRQREEEERKERERRHREEMERKRAAREAEARRVREEQERAKLDKLPPLLRWLQMCSNPKSEAVAEKFRFMSGVRYDTIRPEATGTPEGREQWVLNTHAALLLGEKDLDLSRYTAWERAPVSRLAKITLWRVEWDLYSLISEKYWDLGLQLPGYYGDEDPASLNFKTRQRLKQAAWERFLNTDMFFVKLSELLYTVSNTPHLRNVMLAVEYRELLENEAQAVGWQTPQKWKQDPDMDKYFGFAPRHKYYLNGDFVKEDLPSKHEVSKTPFPETRLPRRGLVQVASDDPDYERICIEQGLTHLVKKVESPSLPNGIHASVPEQPTFVNGTNGHGLNGMNGSSRHP